VIYEYEKALWNDILKNSEKDLFQCHFFHHISHMDIPRPLFVSGVSKYLNSETFSYGLLLILTVKL
jgi:hypothetical protein